MNYKITYSSEPDRLIAAVIMDAKPTIPDIEGKSGFETKAFVDSQIELATQSGGLTYNIATFDGNIAAVMSLLVTNMGLTVNKIFQYIRPNFVSLKSDIDAAATAFINNGGWKGDYLV